MSRLTFPKHIGFLAGTLGQGGAERQLYYMLQMLRAHGVRLRVLSLTRGEFWEERIRDLGIPVTWVGKAASRPRRLRRIIQVLREDPPQILQSQHFYTNLYAAMAARALRVREIGAVRSDGNTELVASGPFFGCLSLHFTRLIAANSVAAIELLRRHGVPRERLRLLPNVVDTDLFRERTTGPGEVVCLAAVGRLDTSKRFDRFLEILRTVREVGPVPIRGVVVGDGPARPELERRAAHIGLLPDGLRFLGALEDVTQAYRQADVVVLTSDWEGTPNVILEAMACGLPVAAMAVGGVPDAVVEGETGFLVAPGDAAALLDRVQRLVRDPGLRMRMGRAARRRAETHFSVANLPANLSELYRYVNGGNERQ